MGEKDRKKQRERESVIEKESVRERQANLLCVDLLCVREAGLRGTGEPYLGQRPRDFLRGLRDLDLQICQKKYDISYVELFAESMETLREKI